MASKGDQLEMFFLPFLSPSHMITLSEIASMFAALGQKVTIITTPMNALLLQKIIGKGTNNGHQIRLHILNFSSKEAGLPSGCENYFSITNLDDAAKLYHAMTKLQQQIEQFLHQNPPDCLISDFLFPWTADVALKLKFPRIMYYATLFFPLCAGESVHLHSPQNNVKSDDEFFLLPGLPDPINVAKSQLSDWERIPSGYTQFQNQIRDSVFKSFAVIFNTFEELEPTYAHHYRTVMATKAWALGPASLCNNKNTIDKANRGHQAVIDEHSCLKWLDSKDPNSVLYVSFGSAVRFPKSQLLEIASALEASNCHFIWVVLGKDDKEKGNNESLLFLDRFEEKINKEGEKGFIVRGWAPQVLILDHPAIGGFVTHCGGNSILESVTAGVPMITWPLYSEQFYNEKMVIDVLKIGVGVGKMEWNLWVDAGKEVIKREDIEKAVTKLMKSGDGEGMRERAKQLSVKAKKAVEEGGSAYNNYTTLIKELKEIKASKLKA